MHDPTELDDLTGPWEAVLSGDSGYVIGLADLPGHRYVAVAVVRGTALPVSEGDDRIRPGSWTTDDVLLEVDDFDSDDDVARDFARAQRLAVLLNATDGIALAELQETRHIVDVRTLGWAITHPFACRARGLDTTTCPVANYRFASPFPGVGRFACDVDAEGKLVVGERIEARP